MKNTIGGEVRKLDTLDEVKRFLDEDIRDKVDDLIERLQPEFLVIYRNEDMWSSQHGRIHVLGVGPNLTIKTLKDAVNGRLGDAPSRFAYPFAYYELQNVEDKAGV